MTKYKQPLIILTGPTAAGKTALSIQLAKKAGGEIISADSMQIYRHMDIGSAKVRPEEMQGVRHHLIDVMDPSEEFNVVIFQKMAKECMEGIYERGHIPILTGGTGFYIQAVLYDIDFTENEEDAAYRKELEKLAAEKGKAFLHRMLQEADEASAAAIHENNTKRVIRALEFYKMTGKKISEHNERERKKEAAYQACYFVLDEERESLYRKIDSRVDGMIENGLVEEVKRLRQMGCHKNMVSMQGLGYKEILCFLEGEISLERAIYLIKRDTRHFAKRQLTWFRREKDVIWVSKNDFSGENGTEEEKIMDFLLKELEDKGILGIQERKREDLC